MQTFPLQVSAPGKLPRARTNKQAGWTLLELLIALAIAAAASGLLASRLISISHPLGLSAESILRDLDGRARLLSRRGETVLFILRDSKLVDRRGTVLAERTWPRNTDVSTPAGLGAIEYSPGGTCQDYEIWIHQSGESTQWQVSGLSGWITSIP